MDIWEVQVFNLDLKRIKFVYSRLNGGNMNPGKDTLKANNPVCGGIYNWHYAKRFSNHNPCEWMRFR